MGEEIIRIRQPVNTFRQLLYNKYGEANFAVACEIVARWLRFETKKGYTQEWVNDLCNRKSDGSQWLNDEEATALRRLFGIKRNDIS